MYSEMWETPTPSDDEFASRFKNSTIASGGMNDQAAMYCAFSKEKSAVCDEINLGNYSGDGIIYKRDRYWNKAAVLPSGVSVLLMNGKLDQQTSYKYAQYLLEALGTSKKELITFDYAIHDIVRTTQLGDPSDPNLTCGMKLLVSFISNNGDLRRLDRSCVSKTPAFNLTVPPAYLYNFFKTNDAYDGIYQVTN
ncbi:uncharacterized protein IUM83_13215 [Phytophthora cinnamomi]|uniref:uncharacterized protein n=1 Tax=Phytophthora cinnamomi TaxID=4785 RepID=UPI003559E413|nr:hypothetical protein IUM83_13215 [Phytophthora cinnamomi]